MNTVQNNFDEQRFEIEVEGELAGVARYRSSLGVRTFFRTKIEERFQGRNIGRQLVQSALDETRAEGLSVIPECSYVRAFILKHSEYQDLVPKDRWEEFKLL